MNSIERRIHKLESELPRLPCSNPEHREISLFVYGIGEEQDLENDGRLESMRQCERCRREPPLIFILSGRGPGRHHDEVQGA